MAENLSGSPLFFCQPPGDTASNRRDGSERTAGKRRKVSGEVSEGRQKEDRKAELHMRLDKYLKVSRLIKRRTVANEACDGGRVQVNGKPAKASVNVKEGDVITISFGNKEVKVEVLDVQETVKKGRSKRAFPIFVTLLSMNGSSSA